MDRYGSPTYLHGNNQCLKQAVFLRAPARDDPMVANVERAALSGRNREMFLRQLLGTRTAKAKQALPDEALLFTHSAINRANGSIL